MLSVLELNFLTMGRDKTQVKRAVPNFSRDKSCDFVILCNPGGSHVAGLTKPRITVIYCTKS